MTTSEKLDGEEETGNTHVQRRRWYTLNVKQKGKKMKN